MENDLSNGGNEHNSSLGVPIALKIEQPLPQQDQFPENWGNRTWCKDEHLLYLVFLFINRDRIKNNSNKFFQEMADFLRSKSEIQCRSHHQKYQSKYKYPHRIIREEKSKCQISQNEFSKIVQNIRQNPRFSHYFSNERCKREGAGVKRKLSNVSTECQTEIQGLQIIFMTHQEYELSKRQAPPVYQFASYPSSTYMQSYSPIQGFGDQLR